MPMNAHYHDFLCEWRCYFGQQVAPKDTIIFIAQPVRDATQNLQNVYDTHDTDHVTCKMEPLFQLVKNDKICPAKNAYVRAKSRLTGQCVRRLPNSYFKPCILYSIVLYCTLLYSTLLSIVEKSKVE